MPMWVPPNRIVPSAFQEPPNCALPVKSQSVSGVPPEASIFFSLPPDANARKRLSGDQKKVFAPSVPASSRACMESRERIQIPAAFLTLNAIRRQFGESASQLAKSCFYGGRMVRRRAAAGAGDSPKWITARLAEANAKRAAATHGSRAERVAGGA